MKNRKRKTYAAMRAWIADREARYPWVPVRWYDRRNPRQAYARQPLALPPPADRLRATPQGHDHPA